MMIRRTVVRALALFVCLVAIAATVLFLRQGGFGGGHLRYDQILGLLGLPWTLIPWPEAFFSRSDFVWLVALPFLLNLGIVFLLRAALYRKKTNQ